MRILPAVKSQFETAWSSWLIIPLLMPWRLEARSCALCGRRGGGGEANGNVSEEGGRHNRLTRGYFLVVRFLSTHCSLRQRTADFRRSRRRRVFFFFFFRFRRREARVRSSVRPGCDLPHYRQRAPSNFFFIYCLLLLLFTGSFCLLRTISISAAAPVALLFLEIASL